VNVPIKRDATPPVVSVTGFNNNDVFVLGVDTLPTPGCSTTDETSGVKTEASATPSGGPVGAITVTCSGAEDVAGNTAESKATYYVHWNWSGFFIEETTTAGNSTLHYDATRRPVHLCLEDGQDVGRHLPSASGEAGRWHHPRGQLQVDEVGPVHKK
jgi:hypothetical protein